MLQKGDQAPDFSAPDDAGGTVRLSKFRGQPVVLYFYPKDGTPNCAKEACSFRDSAGGLAKAGAVVIGVSPDDVASHDQFKQQHGLPFPLVADVDHSIADAYGVWIERSMLGKTYWANARTTFLIDPSGTIAHIWENVTPLGHADQVLEVLGSGAKRLARSC